MWFFTGTNMNFKLDKSTHPSSQIETLFLDSMQGRSSCGPVWCPSRTTSRASASPPPPCHCRRRCLPGVQQQMQELRSLLKWAPLVLFHILHILHSQLSNPRWHIPTGFCQNSERNQRSCTLKNQKTYITLYVVRKASSVLDQNLICIIITPPQQLNSPILLCRPYSC